MSKSDQSLVEGFLKRHKKKKSGGTGEIRELGLSRFTEWVEAEDRGQIPELDKWDIEDFIIDLDGQGYAPKTIETTWGSVSVFYGYLEERDIVDNDPTENIEFGDFKSISGTKKKEVTRNTEGLIYVTPGEKEDLCEHVPDPKIRNELIIRLLWQTGIREHELRNIRIEDVDTDTRTVNIRSGKSHRDRTLAFQPTLTGLYDLWVNGGYRDSYTAAEDSDYVFLTHRSGQMSQGTVNKVVRNAAENAGIQEDLYVDAKDNTRYKITTHALRHGFGMAALNNGMPLKYIQDALGHADIETTEIYLEAAEEDTLDAMRKYGPGTEKTD
jgi:integrase/recombinase XerD